MKNKMFIWAVISMSGSIFVSILSILTCYWSKKLDSDLFIVGVIITIASIILSISYIVVVARWREVEERLRNIYNAR